MSQTSEEPPSLLAFTIRRSLITGRVTIAVGTGLSVLYAVILALESGSAFASTLPLLLPAFTVIGALGGVMVFTSDRLKGVFEYLLAYGVTPRRIFLNILLTSFVLVTIVLGASLIVGLGVYSATGKTVSTNFALALGVYSLPMSYASVAFAATVGMFWTSLSSPREGMNSQIGLLPLIGVAPPLLTLLAATGAGAVFGAFYVYVVIGASVLLLSLIVVILLSRIDRLMPRERLLSPA